MKNVGTSVIVQDIQHIPILTISNYLATSRLTVSTETRAPLTLYDLRLVIYVLEDSFTGDTILGYLHFEHAVKKKCHGFPIGPSLRVSSRASGVDYSPPAFFKITTPCGFVSSLGKKIEEVCFTAYG